MEFETVIGLEVHLQLATASKIFSSASALFGGEPNQHVDPVTLGLPGCLPVVNKKVIDNAVMLGLALGCEIREESIFARKHYFYPDLPKGYQISQFEEPICERGSLEITLDKGAKRTIGIKRVHMEEDAGKNIHDGRTGTSLIDLNRAGVPLLGIVTEPDLRSPEEAAIYLKTLRQIARFLEISDGNMEEGSLRCDANISLRPVGSLEYGTRTEIKNLNSFRFVEKALEFEIARQSAVLKSGKEIVQATMLFDSTTNATKVLRTKEDSADYRYFPDPDLPPVIVTKRKIEEIKAVMPKLPAQIKVELMQGGLSEYDANVLTAEKPFYEYYREVFSACKNSKTACSWVTSELFGYLNREGKSIQDSPIAASDLGRLTYLIETDVISGKIGKTVFEEMYTSGKKPDDIIAEKGLKQVTDEVEIQKIVEGVLKEKSELVAQYKAGEKKIVGFLVGEIMKASKGSANPKKANEILLRLLNS